ncbi:MAG TPA: hypothetical protein VJB95_03300 [Candidatus Paceibacterota bacterium]
MDSFLTNVNKEIINPLIVLLFALALVYFLYGVFEFLVGAASEEKKTDGKSHMLWGIVGITIMMGVWTILGIVTRTLNIDSQVKPQTNEVKLDSYNPGGNWFK